MDGWVTVRWVREFSDDYEDICEATLNKSHDDGKLSECLLTAIMKILR